LRTRTPIAPATAQRPRGGATALAAMMNVDDSLLDNNALWCFLASNLDQEPLCTKSSMLWQFAGEKNLIGPAYEVFKPLP
jgi:hypothetical protein